MHRLINWIIERIVFFFKFALFLSVFGVLAIYSTIHAAIYGGQIMSDDAWFLSKILFLILAPGFVAFVVTRKRGAVAFTGALLLGYVASLLLACSPVFSWGNYTHAPSFREAKLYYVEAGKLVVPEKNREDLLNACGMIDIPQSGNSYMRDSCEEIIYCQSWDTPTYERELYAGTTKFTGGCDQLLRKNTSPSTLDFALQ